ncbi:ABC transporter permease [Fulvimonas soli]|jgi:putative ABC transport system permease protein|uniref:Putative ABC transport system permease protein n=1 Tax=Fulvimonas soli TaxID=155197 RepID=A0A316I8B6_9GAMM|nr:FtsX-like permease family protein [Fulvimonas soli]PWK88709.1 putative ABC transport system permease protein [Fulvimonas soli]TNY25466.1 hypothetical protein BV497_13720 [Fulvimonas soli]
MEIRPILATLRKHRIPALLIVLEIALACAVLCNAVFMISRRVSNIHLFNGIDERGLVVVNLNGTDPKRASSEIPRNLAALRGIAGVQAAAITSSVPLSTNNWGWSFGLTPEANVSSHNTTNVSLYMLGEGGDRALGLQLREGRLFGPGEYAAGALGDAALPQGHVTVLTESLARRLWPGQSALGKTLYSRPYYYTVVGVAADVLRPYFGTWNPKMYDVAYFPVNYDAPLGTYVLRSAPQERDRVLREAVDKLQALNPAAVAKGSTYADVRAKYFADTSSMAWMLVLVCVVMLAVTALGIVGLSSFWVAQRRRTIGIRRAMGATRGAILRYFQTENFLLATLGIVLGMVLAYGINLFLMKHYELPRMPAAYFPVGAVTLWLIGQLAVLGPALRAAAVPPVVATRAA